MPSVSSESKISNVEEHKSDELNEYAVSFKTYAGIDKETIVEFINPANCATFSTCFLLSIVESENVFKLGKFYIPKDIPVRELEGEYLHQADGIDVFANAVAKCIGAYFFRRKQVEQLKECDYVEKQYVYNNQSYTYIYFEINVPIESNPLVVVTLEYEANSTLPHLCNLQCVGNVVLNMEEDEALSQFKNLLLKEPVAHVIAQCFAQEDASGQVTNGEGESNSFDIFDWI